MMQVVEVVTGEIYRVFDQEEWQRAYELRDELQADAIRRKGQDLSKIRFGVKPV